MKTPDQKQDEVWVIESMKAHGFTDVEFGPRSPDIILNQSISIESNQAY
jgi:hypothetical protein